MSKLVPPHGRAELMPLLLPEAKRAERLRRAQGLIQVPMTSRETSDFLMLGMGAYTPLAGFMGREDWRSCCGDMKLSTGLFWPIPITLSCAKDLADRIAVNATVALVAQDAGEIMGELEVTEKYTIDKSFECQNVFRTVDPKHPGVAKVMEQGEINLGGRVTALSEGTYPHQYKGLYYRPAETRALFAERGWSRVRSVSDAQSDAPQPRVPGQDRDRSLRWRAHPSSAGGA